MLLTNNYSTTLYNTKVVNVSMSEGIMLSELKKALLLHLFKKTLTLKFENMPSNLVYISNLIERLVATCLLSHIVTNNLDDLFQSTYNQFHSTETALLKD